MEQYINFVVAKWYIVIPALLVLVILVWFLINRGYLQSLDIFGLKLSFNSDSERLNKTKSFGRNKLKDYQIQFTKTALANIGSLGITEDKVIKLIEGEFIHHTNYFLWDLQDYPLPVQLNYIVVLDKVGKSLTIRAVKLSDFNKSELISISNLLADYRRLGRYKYRTEPNYILRPEAVKKIVHSHFELLNRLLRHYEIYKDTSFDGDGATNLVAGYLNYEFLIERVHDNPSKIEEFQIALEDMLPKDKGLAYNIISAAKAVGEIDDLLVDLENEFISSNVAAQEVVLSLERSLQYIHKSVNALFAT